MPSARTIAVFVSGVILVSAAAGWWRMRGPDLNRTYKIGHLRPRSEHAATGRPGGPIVEIAAEAARRAGVKLHWVEYSESPETAVASGAIDLWPMINDIPGRTGIYVSEPYLASTYFLVVLEETPPRALRGWGGVAGTANPAGDTIVRSHLPGVKIRRYPRMPALMGAVCAGEIDGAVVGSSMQQSAPLPLAAGCRVRLEPIPDARLLSGIGATGHDRDAQKVADLIRLAISDMIRDGTFITISFRWHSNISQDALMVEYALNAQHSAEWRGRAVIAIFTVAMALVWMAWRLRTARVEALRAAAAKGQFLANMSHEIRTPMNGVLGMTELVLGTPLKPVQREYLTYVHSSAEALLQILNDILDFSKIEAGKLELSETPLDLRRCVQGMVDTLAFAARQKELELSLDIDPGVPDHVLGDAGRIRQVLLNLAGNAVKFTASGSVRVFVTNDGADLGRNRIHFVIYDTGIGVAPEQQSQIFRPFEQADTSATRRHGGTGLGLSISLNLVHMMGGAIWVDSPWIDPVTGKPRTGSAFHFTVLLAACEGPVAPAPAKAATPLGSLSILVAEDNPVSSKVVTALLEKAGHQVTTAINGEEAVELALSRTFDLILMDVHMPELDGIAATRKIRAAGKNTPVVALTAAAFDSDRDRCVEAGMDRFLAKPVRREELLATIADACLSHRIPHPPQVQSESGNRVAAGD
ncbi:MAG: response regulator [Acidobacteria bacterium]|nr:response regulator [Acidobacteriota bacterium]